MTTLYPTASAEDLALVVRSINNTLQANVCLLTLLQGQTLRPLAIVGASQRELHDAELQAFLQQCSGLQQFNPIFSLSFEGSALSTPYRFAAEYPHSHHLQIVWNDDTDFRILLSLFYKQRKMIALPQVKEIETLVRRNKDLFVASTLLLPAALAQKPLESDGIIGQSQQIRKVRAMIWQVAETNSDVLIVGETGTGKELIARTIHQHSLRKDGAFIPVDCVAIPANLLESELFGFEKGAFTGAAGMKHGLFELAHQGTLFLDEISELEINLQAKLLRVLQERQFRRLGSEHLIRVDMRVIAAMNQRPAKAMSHGNLRKDLFYRLNIIPMHLPPLRHRTEDIPVLVEHFLEKAIKKNHLSAKTISPEALALLQNYHWPGNVRQLQNVVERLTVLSQNAVISAPDIPAKYQTLRRNPNTHLSFSEAKKRHLANFEKDYFTKLLVETKFNISQAAQIAGISDRTIYRMLQRYGSLRNGINGSERSNLERNNST